MKIGLFGGSFDPIHNGHIEISKEAIKQFHLDAFYFIPTKNNPWKDKSNASSLDRIKMIEIAISKYPLMNIETIEIDDESDNKNYTIHTLKKLIKEDNEYYYLMGMDQVIAFDKWKDSYEISKMVQLVAFNRGGYENDHENINKYHFIKMNNKPMEISSSAIRDGEIKHLDKDVLHYLSNHGLYIDTMIKNRMKDKRYKHSLSVASLTSELCQSNNIDPLKGYIGGIMHDVAKELPNDIASLMMDKYYPKYKDKPLPIWHQWLSSYIAKNEFLIDDEEILKAIEDHTTASTSMSKLAKCLYCADKLDPLRGYDSSASIKLCKENIDEGFKNELQNFYDFSKSKNREIDEVFFKVYNKYVKGEK